MLITALGLAIVVAVAFFVAWPMLSGREATEEPGAAAGDGGPSEPERRRDALLAALKEAEFDHQVGKTSDEDYRAQRAELEARALAAISDVEAARAAGSESGAPAAGAREPAAEAHAARDRRARALHAIRSGPADGSESGAATGRPRFCPACGRKNPGAASFCGACGRALAAGERRRRRA
ncbi:MAG TPA: zinc ribbon domain-containing protein [Candidatus Binatia bacterium]|nr:zinc ribbon domain-containing protein [Candidatus Binatia bacterium]